MTGIYKITNLDNGKMYVGQAVNIYERWGKHKLKLKKNIHENNYLQHSWNLHGDDKFVFSVIQECCIEELDDLEIYWIDQLRTYIGFDDCNGYNQTLGGKGNKKTSEDNIKMICDLFNSGMSIDDISTKIGWRYRRVRDYLKIGASNNLCKYNPKNEQVKSHSIQVICLNNRKIFSSVKEAERYYNIHSISDCCNGKIKYAGRDSNGEYLLWMYYYEFLDLSLDQIKNKIEEMKNDIYSKHIVCLNNKKIFEGVKQAAREYQFIAYWSIYDCCKGKCLYGGQNKETGEKYVWVYYNDYIKMSSDDINNRMKLID